MSNFTPIDLSKLPAPDVIETLDFEALLTDYTHFHGVFSPSSKLRKDVVPQKPVEEQALTSSDALLHIFNGSVPDIFNTG